MRLVYISLAMSTARSSRRSVDSPSNDTSQSDRPPLHLSSSPLQVKTGHVLDAVRWPVLKWSRMAGFEVTTEDDPPRNELGLPARSSMRFWGRYGLIWFGAAGGAEIPRNFDPTQPTDDAKR